MVAEGIESPLGPSSWLSEDHVESFLAHLRVAGYAEETLRKKRSVVVAFARWSRHEQVTDSDLRESHIAAFTKRPPRRAEARVVYEFGVLRPFVRFICPEAGIQAGAVERSVAGEFERRYVGHLQRDRGLAAQSIYVYMPYVRDFLHDMTLNLGSSFPGGLDAAIVRDFLLDRIRGRSSEYSRLLATCLRSFLRFLFLRGETAVDLSSCVPTVRKWNQAAVPTVLSPEEVERVLEATNQPTPRGRRNHAILLLLARLGLRAGEVVALELGDICWRAAEIVVRGKGREIHRLPLLPDVGEALALYLREARGRSTCRRVFLRMLAPRVGLTGPAAVGHIVRRAFALAGVRPTCRGAAHLFRHSLASKMLCRGASIAQISEVLRHRCQATTQIYAKVDFQALRDVARPWPGAGGEQ